MDYADKLARRETGIAKWEKECRLVRYGNRRVKAYRIPWTPEWNYHALLVQITNNEAERIRKSDDQYRYTNGHLYELSGDVYIHCYTSRANSKKAAIQEYEEAKAIVSIIGNS